MRSVRERLADAVQAIENVQRYSGATKEEFEANELLQAWYVRHLEIIGEALSRVPAAVRANAPDIRWANIAGMRNVLAHGYFAIDIDIVWEAATTDLPALRRGLERLLETPLEGDTRSNDDSRP